MPQALVWTGRALRSEAMTVLAGLASFLRMEVMACEQIASILRGERPTNLVNADVWGRQRT